MLIWLDAIEAAVELTAYGDVGSVRTVVVNAGVTLGVDSNLEVGVAGSGNQDAQVRREQHIGIFTGLIIGFKGSAIESHHERG